MIGQLTHWRIAGASAVFVLAGSSAVVIAVNHAPARAYQPNAATAPRRHPAVAATAAERSGRALLAQAVAACRSTAFSGIQVSRTWGAAGSRVWRTAIWHPPGSQTVAVPVADGVGSPGELPELPAPSVSITLSKQQLTLLETDYVLDYAGHGVAGGRRAELVTVHRLDGMRVARIWVDDKTRLPLRRQLFDDHARVLSDLSVARLRTGSQALAGMPAARPVPWPRPLGRSELTALRASGWPVPAQLPGGMLLFAASSTDEGAGEVVAASYSDGLSVISVFVQRGALSARMPGWRPVAIGGHDAYTRDPDEQTVAWSAGGYVFTVLADAPPAAVDQALAALPHGGEPGFFGRLARGFGRLASWANPFR